MDGLRLWSEDSLTLDKRRHIVRGMGTLRWKTDERTADAAKRYCPIKSDLPGKQFEGRTFHAHRWERRVMQPSAWPSGLLRSSPERIIQQFEAGRYTQALAMIVSWGTMARTSRAIWGARKPAAIDKVLHDCAERTEESESIEDSWDLLTGQGEGKLGWSDVMASKTLHFLCRSLGFCENPPAPIDGKIIVQRVWPDFRENSKDSSVEGWRAPDRSFDAYSRYMSAISIWAEHKHWTTTDVETALFAEFNSR